uniref:BpiB07 n=1 Tax=uncultured bacterium Bio9 TaxID=460942 RepID=B2BKC2_9BACT|nr:BpiB07 [uncultured bacterium Bio9]
MGTARHPSRAGVKAAGLQSRGCRRQAAGPTETTYSCGGHGTAKKSQRAFEREPGAGGIVGTRIDLAIECVPSRWICIYFCIGQRAAMAFDRFRGNRRVLFTEMELHRRLGFFVEEVHVACAVVADRRQAQSGRSEKCDRPAPAVADAADAPRGRDRFGCAGDVLDRLVEADFAHEFPAARVTRFVVAELDAAFDMIEERRRDCGVAVVGETVGDVAHVRIDAEDFLHDDDAAFRRALRLRDVGADALHARRIEVDLLAHGGAVSL